MMMYKKIFYLLGLSLVLTSCITTKDVQYLQPSESLVINEEGLVPYNIPEYRVTKNDMFNLNIVTTPQGDAAQFYSAYNTKTSKEGTTGSSTTTNNSNASSVKMGGNPTFYFEGVRVDHLGNLNVIGILDPIKAEGRTITDIEKEIQDKVNENFLEGKSQVRLNLDGIKYFLLGDIETSIESGEKKSYTNSLNILEAIAQNGGLNRSIDRTNIILQRRLPEGIKRVRLDLTREDAMNSQYFWIQNGDMILLNTRSKSLNGFGKDPIQTLGTSVSLLTTVISIYLLATKL